MRRAFANLFFEKDVLVLELDVQEAVFQQVANAQERVTWADWKQLFAYRATWGVVIGIFGEASLDVVDRSSNNLLQVNCGLRFAF